MARLVARAHLHFVTPRLPSRDGAVPRSNTAKDMPKPDVLVTHFGASGTGEALDTAPIQAAIDAAAAQGGGQVRFPPGKYLSGTVFLRSNVSLYFESGATLLGSHRLEDYSPEVALFVDAVGQQRGRCLILAHAVEHVGLEGDGVIHGNGAAFLEPEKYAGRPFLIRFVACADVFVRDLLLRDSAAWVSHFEGCDHVRVENVTIRSRVNHNNDGIDIDSCSDVLVEGCDIDTGDDAICLKATLIKPCENVRVRNCRLSSGCGAIKLGTESYGDFRNITINHCEIYDTGLCGIKVLNMDGAIMEDVLISGITMVRTTGPLFVRLGDRGRTYGQANDDRRPPGKIRRLTLRDIKATVQVPSNSIKNPYTNVNQPPKAFSGVLITGIPGRPIEDLLLENVEISFVGLGVERDAAAEPTEQISDYPEHYYFGVLPSWGFFLRHLVGVRLSQVRISTQNSDERPSLACEDVTGFRLDGWRELNDQEARPIRYRNTRGVLIDGKPLLNK
jgi:hypothetical protein